MRRPPTRGMEAPDTDLGSASLPPTLSLTISGGNDKLTQDHCLGGNFTLHWNGRRKPFPFVAYLQSDMIMSLIIRRYQKR
jgi:hypothetical protein